MRRNTLFLVLVSSLALSFATCGERLPAPKTSHKVIQKYFVKYGKKFKTSDFGGRPVERLEIVDQREMQKDLVETLAYLQLEGREPVAVRVTLRKKTFGWKAVAWENLGKKEASPPHPDRSERP